MHFWLCVFKQLFSFFKDCFICSKCIFVLLILIILFLLSFIHNQIHSYTFIVNNEKLKTSFALIRVLTIVIIDGSANVRYIKGLDVVFSLLRYFVSGHQYLIKKIIFLFFLLIQPLSMVTSICLLYTRLSATRKEEALFLFILKSLLVL